MKIRYLLLLGFLHLVAACKSDQDLAKERYLGKWQTESGKSKITVYQENDGVFVNDGIKVFPIKYEPEGKYFSFPGVGRPVNLLISNDTLTVSGAVTIKYIKLKE